jgi:hypothetical protein
MHLSLCNNDEIATIYFREDHEKIVLEEAQASLFLYFLIFLLFLVGFHLLRQALLIDGLLSLNIMKTLENENAGKMLLQTVFSEKSPTM